MDITVKKAKDEKVYSMIKMTDAKFDKRTSNIQFIWIIKIKGFQV